jgi:succinylglutamic semialdehyde dehydrogenase
LMNPVGKLIISPEVVPAAVEQAVKAFPKWRGLSVSKRISKLKAVQRTLKKRQSELTRLVAMEVGKPLIEAHREVDRFIAKLDDTLGAGLGLIRSFDVKVAKGVQGECHYRPLGALAVIGPFNFPAHTPGSHILPALLVGNTVVFKPSEYTPFVGQLIAEAFHSAGFPKGVFNLVQGGTPVGVKLVEHPQIQGVLFTGSTAAGSAIKAATLKAPWKILALEMGGKNAALVLGDADLELAAKESVVAAFSMAGQRCNATSRILVERKVAKPFLKLFLELAERVKVGYPLEEGVLMGPLVSHEAVGKFQRYVKMASEGGFQTLRAGKTLGSWGKRRGYYVTPAVHLNEQPSLKALSRYRQEEIFGPDAAIQLVRNEAEAVAINNEVVYGLVTSVFTKSRSRFERLLPEIDTGMVNFNRGTIFSSGKLPFGGTKASGSFQPAGLFSPYYCTVPIAVLKDERKLSERAFPL